MKRVGWLIIVALALAVACGSVANQNQNHPDAKTPDTVTGAHTCVFDTDTFDSACTFAL